jgi:hypothetical protein
VSVRDCQRLDVSHFRVRDKEKKQKEHIPS